jgi:hemolysin D
VDGRVQQLSVHTAGGVVTPAQVLLVVVPDHAEVTAEVTLENKDIGFIDVGQIAEIKFETFPYTRYGTVQARVTSVAADAVMSSTATTANADGRSAATDTQTKSASTGFPALLTLSRSDIDIDGHRIHLSPGMNLTAEIQTGKRRVIDYLLSPISEHLGESMKER